MVELGDDEVTTWDFGAARAEPIRVGDLLAGKYRAERVQQQSALGITLEAMHEQLGQRVSIRVSSADPRAYPEASARFLRGARLAVRFQNAHTARIIDVGTLDSGAPYIASELLTGSDLRRVLRVREVLPVSEAVDYTLQACEALADAHAHGLVHKNLEPSNMFVVRRETERQLIVLNFCLSDDPLSDAAINLGSTQHATQSLAYLAPEQIRDPASVDARVDIWALGALLHEMLSGAAPFRAETTPALLAMIAAEEAAPLSHLRPEIPDQLESLVLRCLAKDPRERFGSLGELCEALAPFASEGRELSARRVVRSLARRGGTSLPPPLPGAQPTKAIVRVAPAAVTAKPAAAPVPTAPARRWAELALTALALAAAGALGVFVAVRMMENALAAALAPRQVVAELSPALPAPVLVAPPVAPQPSASAAPVVARPAARRATPAPAPAKVTLTERAVVAKAPSSGGLFDDAN